jgi:hypothetical protein
VDLRAGGGLRHPLRHVRRPGARGPADLPCPRRPQGAEAEVDPEGGQAPRLADPRRRHPGQQRRCDRHPRPGPEVLDDDYVSTRHARIAASGDQWFVEDLGSTNGTYIGTVRITQPTTITLGTQVRIGKTILELQK